MHSTSSGPASTPRCLSSAAGAFGNPALSHSEAHRFLRCLAALAATLVPGCTCCITVRRDQELASVASDETLPLRVDLLRLLHGPGPGLEALQTSARVDVADTASERRWGDYGERAQAQQIRSSTAIPLVCDGFAIGSLSLFSGQPQAFSPADLARVQDFATHAATVLAVLVGQSHQVILDDELRTTLTTRSVIDQALGILMYTQQLSSRQAFEALRSASQRTNRKVSALASDLITSMTGHQPEPPRPLAQRAPRIPRPRRGPATTDG